MLLTESVKPLPSKSWEWWALPHSLPVRGALAHQPNNQKSKQLLGTHPFTLLEQTHCKQKQSKVFVHLQRYILLGKYQRKSTKINKKPAKKIKKAKEKQSEHQYILQKIPDSHMSTVSQRKPSFTFELLFFFWNRAKRGWNTEPAVVPQGSVATKWSFKRVSKVDNLKSLLYNPSSLSVFILGGVLKSKPEQVTLFRGLSCSLVAQSSGAVLKQEPVSCKKQHQP